MAYPELIAHLRKLDRMSSIHALVSWDEQVNLPEKSTGLRSDQHAVLSTWLHQESTRKEIGDWLADLEKQADSLSPDEKAVIRTARRDYDRANRLPAEFIERRVRARSEGFHAWKSARASNRFGDFAPFLQKHLDLAREEADLLGAEDPYNYWIDQFDEGMSREVIRPLFDELQAGLAPVVDTITNSSVQPDPSIFRGFPVDRQNAFLLEVLHKIGFDFERGRLDIAVHPFCGGHPADIRMTTRYDADNPLDSWSSALHEAGHAMYEQGLEREMTGTALGSAVGMAFHESQSRLWENQVGRSREFWSHWEPRYRHHFEDQLKNVSSEELFLAINRVAVTPIRVDADEVTYNLHIILRFQLEEALFTGRLKVADLPEAWNEKSRELLGYDPRSNREGCLQDVHWSEGMFGYFPSYAIGNLLAAQLWYALREDLPDLDARIAAADYAPLLGWLREKVHAEGARHRTGELIKKITGEELSPRFLVRYLKERYLPLYSE